MSRLPGPLVDRLLSPISILSGRMVHLRRTYKDVALNKDYSCLCIVSMGDPGEPPPSLPLLGSFSNDGGVGKKNVT